MTESNTDQILLKVSSKSNVGRLASAISHAVYDGKTVLLRAIGAGAVNQATKALAVAQGYTATRGYQIAVRPGFDEVQMPEGETTAILFRVIVF